MTLAEFFAMNGYGFYVWGSYGLALFVFLIETTLVRHRRTLVLRQLKLMNESEEV